MSDLLLGYNQFACQRGLAMQLNDTPACIEFARGDRVATTSGLSKGCQLYEYAVAETIASPLVAATVVPCKQRSHWMT